MRTLLIVELGHQPASRGKKNNEIDGQKRSTQTITQQSYYTGQKGLNPTDHRMKQQIETALRP